MSQVDTKPTEEWGDIGGLDKQIQELMEVRAFRPCSSSHAILVRL
jgi:ATP-dependent 26S proteasome regulatory subunit